MDGAAGARLGSLGTAQRDERAAAQLDAMATLLERR
jgi:hypothetical protein